MDSTTLSWKNTSTYGLAVAGGSWGWNNYAGTSFSQTTGTDWDIYVYQTAAGTNVDWTARVHYQGYSFDGKSLSCGEYHAIEINHSFWQNWSSNQKRSTASHESRVGCGGVGVCWLFVWFWVWWPFFGLVLFWLLGVWLVGSVGRWRWLAGGLVVLSGLGGVGGAGCGGVVGGWCWWCWFCGGFRGWLVWVGWCFRVSVSTRRGGGGRRGVLFRRS